LPDFTIAPYAEQDAVDEQAVIELWTGEGVLGLEEARRRVGELRLIATTETGELAGITTTYLAHHPHVDMTLWHLRAFVAAPYRRTALATLIAVETRAHHQRRWAEGDRRGDGLVMEIENPLLRQAFPWAWWPQMDFLFVGFAPSGAPIYVHYFRGARAPAAPTAQGS
jgi:hypothetical protein